MIFYKIRNKDNPKLYWYNGGKCQHRWQEYGEVWQREPHVKSAHRHMPDEDREKAEIIMGEVNTWLLLEH